MTAINYIIEEDSVRLYMDTLSILSTDKKPLNYTTKFIALPHLDTVIAGTGDAGFVNNWMFSVKGSVAIKDIDHLNELTPGELAAISSIHSEFKGVTATIYHFGYSPSKKRFVGYVYKSAENWNPDLQKDLCNLKPPIKFDTKRAGAGFSSDEMVEVMLCQRKADLIKPLGDKIGIGGDIHEVIMDLNGIAVKRVYRFDSYESDYCEMLSRR